jgi:hypothetical protein
METFKEASKIISQTIKDLEEKGATLKTQELQLSQKQEELDILDKKIEDRIKKYTIEPEVVETQRIKNGKTAEELVEREQKLSIKEEVVSRKETELVKREEDVKARLRDIEILENRIKDREIKLIEDRKNMKEEIEKEVFNKLMK